MDDVECLFTQAQKLSLAMLELQQKWTQKSAAHSEPLCSEISDVRFLQKQRKILLQKKKCTARSTLM